MQNRHCIAHILTAERKETPNRALYTWWLCIKSILLKKKLEKGKFARETLQCIFVLLVPLKVITEYQKVHEVLAEDSEEQSNFCLLGFATFCCLRGIQNCNNVLKKSTTKCRRRDWKENED